MSHSDFFSKWVFRFAQSQYMFTPSQQRLVAPEVCYFFNFSQRDIFLFGSEIISMAKHWVHTISWFVNLSENVSENMSECKKPKSGAERMRKYREENKLKIKFKIKLVHLVSILTPNSLNFTKTPFFFTKYATFYKKFPLFIKNYPWPLYKKKSNLWYQHL